MTKHTIELSAAGLEQQRRPLVLAKGDTVWLVGSGAKVPRRLTLRSERERVPLEVLRDEDHSWFTVATYADLVHDRVRLS